MSKITRIAIDCQSCIDSQWFTEDSASCRNHEVCREPAWDRVIKLWGGLELQLNVSGTALALLNNKPGPVLGLGLELL